MKICGLGFSHKVYLLSYCFFAVFKKHRADIIIVLSFAIATVEEEG